MRCPFCNHEESKVIDKRETGESLQITRRRRECLQCKRRFTTYETVEEFSLFIVKKDGRREPFDRKKLISGLEKACEKRPVSREKIEQTAKDLEAELRSMNSSEITSHLVGEKMMENLEKLDKVAFIRFASVYREFTDLDAFSRELNKLLKKED